MYFIYGNHWCMNAVCGPGEQPHAVLLRAAAPLAGVDAMRDRRRRGRRATATSARGPGPARRRRSASTARYDGTDLVRGALRIVDDGVAPPARPGVSPRIGLGAGKGEDLPYRFYVPGDENISRRR